MSANPMTEARFAWQQAARTYAGRSWTDRAMKCVGRAWRAGLNPGLAREWRDFLSRPAMEGVVEHFDRIWFKPFSPYLSTRFDGQRRIKVLRDTYELGIGRGGKVREALTGAGKVALAQLDLGEGVGPVVIELGRNPRFEREGELVVSARADQLGGVAIHAALSLERQAGGAVVAYVGAIQGGNGFGEQSVKALAKAMEGLRPKSLAVFLAQEVARGLGAGRLLGAGNGIHMHLRKHLIHIPGLHDIGFDYDGHWGEHEGKPAEDGWMELPLRLTRRPREEIKANKRPMYTRRYAMLDDLERQLAASLSA